MKLHPTEYMKPRKLQFSLTLPPPHATHMHTHVHTHVQASACAKAHAVIIFDTVVYYSFILFKMATLDVHNIMLRLLGSLSILRKKMQILLDKISMDLTGLQNGNDAVSSLLQHCDMKNIKKIHPLFWSIYKPMWLDSVTGSKKVKISVDTSSCDISLIYSLLSNISMLYDNINNPPAVNHCITCTMKLLSTKHVNNCQECNQLKEFTRFIYEVRNFCSHTTENQTYVDFEEGRVKILGCVTAHDLWQKMETVSNYWFNFVTNKGILANVLPVDEGKKILTDLHKTLFDPIEYVKSCHQGAIINLMNFLLTTLIEKKKFSIQIELYFEFIEESLGFVLITKPLKYEDVKVQSQLSNIILDNVAEKLKEIVGIENYAHCNLDQKNVKIKTSSTSMAKDNAARFTLTFKAEHGANIPHSYNDSSSQESKKLQNEIEKQIKSCIDDPIDVFILGWEISSVIISLKLCKLSSELWLEGELKRLTTVVEEAIKGIPLDAMYLAKVELISKKETPESDFSYIFSFTAPSAVTCELITENIQSVKGVIADSNIKGKLPCYCESL